MTGAFALDAIPSGIAIEDKFSSPILAVSFFLSLYPNRVKAILRPPGCKKWTTISKHWPIPNETIASAIAGKEKDIWGLRWGPQTQFAVAVEHDMTVICSADWVIDLGPGAGSKGGKIVACGTPESIAKVSDSKTAAFVAKTLKASQSIKA